jgi:hypothetical protein
MKYSKSTDSQIMDTVILVDTKLSIPNICLELGHSSATFTNWRAKFMA